MIYFIRSGQYVKIGVSARPWARLAEFQTANPEPLEMSAVGPGDYGFESELHRLFGDHRGVGEWFQDNERIRTVVTFMRETFPELQSRPVAIESTLVDTSCDQDSDGWRIETRTYTKRDGTTSMYHNYRSRHISRTPDGQRRVPYRRASDIESDVDYGPDELPSGPRTLDELATMSTKTWRIETNIAGGGNTPVWGWRKRGAVREYRYGGMVVEPATPQEANQ